MYRFPLHTVLLLTGISICGGSASAQLFGDRSIRPNRRPQATNSAAMITGSERFVRGNRTADDFVGAGTSATGTFVGATPPAAISRVTGTVVGPTEEPATQVNVPRSRAAAGLYAERLTINFEPRAGEGFRLPPPTALSGSLSRIARRRGFELALSPANAAALIQGTVSSERQKRIAELLVLFEPGIATVTNELRVEPTVSR